MAKNSGPFGEQFRPLVSVQRSSADSLVDGHLCSGLLFGPRLALLLPPVPDELSRSGELPSGFRLVAGVPRPGEGEGWVATAPLIEIEVNEHKSRGLTAIVVKAGAPGLGDDPVPEDGVSPVAEMGPENEDEAWSLLTELHRTADRPDSAWLYEADQLLRGQPTAISQSDPDGDYLTDENDGRDGHDDDGRCDEDDHRARSDRRPGRRRVERSVPRSTWICKYLHIGCP
jgi:hypothetical protein